MPKICSGWYLVPTHQFFPINYHFLSSPFFPKMPILSTKIWWPTHIFIESSRIPIFDHLILRSLFVSDVFCDNPPPKESNFKLKSDWNDQKSARIEDSANLLSSEAYKPPRLIKIDTFLNPFVVLNTLDHNFRPIISIFS